MRHVILTCRQHPQLRWSTKEVAVTEGKYNGARSIFFLGTPSGRGMHFDGSGLDCTRLKEGELFVECECPPTDLIVAAEDVLVKREGEPLS